MTWALLWKIVKGTLELEWENIYQYTVSTANGDRIFVYPKVKADYADYVKEYEYYHISTNNVELSGGKDGPKKLEDITYTAETAYGYEAVAILKDEWADKYDIKETTKAYPFKVGSIKKEVIVSMAVRQFNYDGQPHGENTDWTCATSGTGSINKNKIITKIYSKNDLENALLGAPSNAGEYVIKFSLDSTDERTYELMITEIEFEITKAEISVTQSGEKEYKYDGTNREGIFTFASDNSIAVTDDYIVKKYYKDNQEVAVPCDAGEYKIVLSVADAYKDNYKIKESDAEQTITITKAKITATQTSSEYEYDGENKEGEFTFTTDNGVNASNVNIVKTYSKGNQAMGGQAPSNAGTYTIVLSVGGNDANNYDIDEDTVEFTITITPAQITAVWENSEDIPTLKGLSEEDLEKIEYVYTDEEGITCKQDELEVGKTYKVKAVIKYEYEDNYIFVDKKGNVLVEEEPTITDEQTFKMKETHVAADPKNPTPDGG
ncbi:MAG: hypothetical protein K2J13_00610, partial [Clostridia bacterium]|nr:hypothetical protein [Clostridia bacterium]